MPLVPRPDRRQFTTLMATSAAAAILTPTGVLMADEPAKEPERDYPAPKFVPKFSKPQLGRTLVQDFVIYAHSELPMVKKLLEKEPKLLNAAVDWGAGDWETALGGASHMGQREIALFLLEQGARPDLFTAAMLGQLAVVKSLLVFQPKLIDAKGPHGFSLHWHAKAGGADATSTLEYLQSVKFVDLAPKKK
ncbi:MAG: ankyrin repeat domain-containing protein [Gemmataceae bacterium]